MHTLTRAIVTATALAASITGTGQGAAAIETQQGGSAATTCSWCGWNEDPATVTPEGVLARAREQMEVLNSGGDEASRQPCMGEHLQWAGHEGYLRWRLTRNGDRAWDMVNGTEGDDATWYRLECYVPAIDPEFGDLIRLQAFDAVTPQNLALVAIDDALAAVPTQDVRTSPADEAMVAIPTWFWVEGLPAEGVTATASVPGMTVTATASPGGVTFHLGDGATLDCDGQGVPYSPGATSDCTHEYQRAGYYPVTSTIRWTGTYQVNGSAPVPIESSVARTSSFDLPVNEAQALNTND